MRAQHDADAPLLDVLRDEREAPIAGQQLAQSPREEIVEARHDDRDGCWRRRRRARRWRAHTFTSTARGRWVSRVSPAAPPPRAGRSPVAEEESRGASGAGCGRWPVRCSPPASLRRWCSRSPDTAQGAQRHRHGASRRVHRHAVARRAAVSARDARDPWRSPRRWPSATGAAVPCGGSVAVQADQPLAAGMQADDRRLGDLRIVARRERPGCAGRAPTRAARSRWRAGNGPPTAASPATGTCSA